MACEAQQALVNQISTELAEAAAQCGMTCSGSNFNSPGCQDCRARVSALQENLALAQVALLKCQADQPQPPAPQLLQTTGYVTFLRVNEPGSGFGGGSTNWFDADVIFMLDARPDKGFGFQLRDDGAQPVRRGMLALLQDAALHGLPVTTDYLELPTTPNNNSFVIRIALENIPVPTSPSNNVGILHQ